MLKQYIRETFPEHFKKSKKAKPDSAVTSSPFIPGPDAALVPVSVSAGPTSPSEGVQTASVLNL
jgi:hypothetical protein